MSNPFAGPGKTAFVVHTDGFDTVKGIAVKKSKGLDVHVKPTVQKRAALGTITNQQRSHTVRSVKPVTFLFDLLLVVLCSVSVTVTIIQLISNAMGAV